LLNPSDTVAVPVQGGNVPELWLLGSSPSSATLAAELGVPFAFARHLSPELTCAADLVSVSVICAEDDQRAEWLAGPIRTKVRGRREGDRILLPGPEDAATLPDDGRVLVGGPETIARKLQAVLDETGTSELMITSQSRADRRHRRRPRTRRVRAGQPRCARRYSGAVILRLNWAPPRCRTP
jgi:alkanesulfonate monooxygenase SsuD/methylene tetrahydromethanopterin reductase-like flavin-dependent oxidoreductase (luciferase family)